MMMQFYISYLRDIFIFQQESESAFPVRYSLKDWQIFQIFVLALVHQEKVKKYVIFKIITSIPPSSNI